MKELTALILALMLSFSAILLTSCGDDEKKDTDGGNTGADQTQSENKNDNGDKDGKDDKDNADTPQYETVNNDGWSPPFRP